MVTTRNATKTIEKEAAAAAAKEERANLTSMSGPASYHSFHGSGAFAPAASKRAHDFADPNGVVEQALRMRSVEPLPSSLPNEFRFVARAAPCGEGAARWRVNNLPRLSIGRTHAATIHAGRCFVWGSEYVSWAGRECPGLLGVGMRGQAGHVYGGDVHTPTPLANAGSAVSVSCGREHTRPRRATVVSSHSATPSGGQCGGKRPPKEGPLPKRPERSPG